MPIEISGTTGISGVDGSASAPALQGSDSNTGLSFGSDVVAFNTGGTERSRFDSNGNLLIGNTSHNNGAFGGNSRGINVAGIQPQVLLHETDTDKDAYFGMSGSQAWFYTADSIDLKFGTADTERMRIDSSGKVLIKTTSDVFGGTDFGVKGQISIANDSSYRRAYLSGSNNHLYFWNGSNQGYLSSSGSWVDSSDENLKKDITDLSYGIDSLKTLKPRKFKMKSDDTEQIGFIAQEVESVIPEVVDTGETPDGSQQKGLAYGHLTAVLTKALQEAVAKIEVLETKVAALEAG